MPFPKYRPAVGARRWLATPECRRVVLTFAAEPPDAVGRAGSLTSSDDAFCDEHHEAAQEAHRSRLVEMAEEEAHEHWDRLERRSRAAPDVMP
jgi:hypothetical protein